MTRITYLPAALALIVVAAAGVRAETRVSHGTVAPGGRASAGELNVYSVVAQPLTGTAANGAMHHDAGFVPVAGRYLLATQTAVVIASFQAEARREGVRLSWTIRSSDGLVGYNVYRSRAEDDGFVNVSGGLLPAERGTAFDDGDARPGATYYYRLGAVDADGEFLSYTVSVTTPVWRTELEQNRPNPFNPSTTISFYLSRAGHATLIVYDATGHRVRTLVDRTLPFGAHDVHWDGTSDAGTRVGSGVYFCRLRAGKEVFTKKMTLLK
jgi:hypothetical protein